MPADTVSDPWRWSLSDWLPDDGLVEKARMMGQPIISMSNADRTWVVVSLSALGWTAQDIADRLSCSLRLIRNIKAEPAAQLAAYALGLRSQIIAIAGTCRLEVSGLRYVLDAQTVQLENLQRQRADLIRQLQLERNTLPTPRRNTA